VGQAGAGLGAGTTRGGRWGHPLLEQPAGFAVTRILDTGSVVLAELRPTCAGEVFDNGWPRSHIVPRTVGRRAFPSPFVTPDAREMRLNKIDKSLPQPHHPKSDLRVSVVEDPFGEDPFGEGEVL
jgi:hypothetical protein